MKGFYFNLSTEGYKDSIFTFLQGGEDFNSIFTLLQRNERILFLPFSRGEKGFYFYLSPVG